MASVNLSAWIVILGSSLVLFSILSTVHKSHRSCIEKFDQTSLQKEKQKEKQQLQELKEYANENLDKIKEQSKIQKELNKKIASADLEFCDKFLVKRLQLSDQWQKTQEDGYLVQLGELLDTLRARNKENHRVTVC